MYRWIPLMFALTACSLVDTPLEPVPTIACQATLDDEAAIEVGHLVGNRFEPLSEGTPLLVHSGPQGGYHSILQIRVSGPGADVEHISGLDISARMSGGWTQLKDGGLYPACRGLGAPGYYTTAWLYWTGPSLLDVCGEDPCTGSGDESQECWDWEDCSIDYGDYDEEYEGPRIHWDDFTAQSADVMVIFDDGAQTLQTTVDGVELDKAEEEPSDLTGG